MGLSCSSQLLMGDMVSMALNLESHYSLSTVWVACHKLSLQRINKPVSNGRG